MGDFGSEASHNYKSTTTPLSSALVLRWWQAGRRRTKSDTASVASGRSSAVRGLINQRSIPYFHSDQFTQLPHPPLGRPAQPRDTILDPLEERATVEDDHVFARSQQSAVSDESFDDEFVEVHQYQTSTMADRTSRQPERPHVLQPEERTERRFQGRRNADTNTTLSSAFTSEPSLFEACRELKRNGVKASFPSLLTLTSPNNNGLTSTQQGRQNVSFPDKDRSLSPSYPEHLFNLPAEPSYLDMCLKTAMLAGYAIEFTPTAATSTGLSNSTICDDCNKHFTNDDEWEKHISKEKSCCPYCDGKFNCHGVLLRHSCNRSMA